MNGASISVAMATYNGAKYLRAQLDSIFFQTFAACEVVVTDDGSTDDTVMILEEYAKIYPLRYYVNDNNLGFCKNFEKAISLCNGDFIALADQDDVWKNEKLEVLLNEIGNYDLVCSDLTVTDQNMKIIHKSFVEYSGITPIYDNNICASFETYFVTGCTVLFSKALKERAFPIPSGVNVHDHWLGLVAINGRGVNYLNQQLVYYRQHGKNQIGASRSATISLREYFFNLFFVRHERNCSQSYVNTSNTVVLPLLVAVRNSSVCVDQRAIKYLDNLIKTYEYFNDQFFSFEHFSHFLTKLGNLKWNMRIKRAMRYFECTVMYHKQ